MWMIAFSMMGGSFLSCTGGVSNTQKVGGRFGSTTWGGQKAEGGCKKHSLPESVLTGPTDAGGVLLN